MLWGLRFGVESVGFLGLGCEIEGQRRLPIRLLSLRESVRSIPVLWGGSKK